MKKIVFLMICSMLLLSSCGNAEIVSQPSLSESIVQSSVDSSEEELKNDGFIAHYDYDEGNELISYNHLNGVLGGISFHDFSEKIDGLAMN